MFQIDCINEQKIECIQIASLENFLVIYDKSFVYYLNIATNKIVIKQKLDFSLNKILNIENSNDLITFHNESELECSSHKKIANLYYVKLVANQELLVIEKHYQKRIDDIKMYKNQLAVLSDERCTIEIYNIEYLLKKSLFESNPLTIQVNKLTTDFVTSFEMAPNCSYLSVLGEQLLLYLIKVSTNAVIAIVPLQIYYKNMIMSNKYVSIFSSNESILCSFLIIDHSEEDHLKRMEELKLNKSFA